MLKETLLSTKWLDFNLENTENEENPNLFPLIIHVRLRWLMGSFLALVAMVSTLLKIVHFEQFYKVIFVLALSFLINNIQEQQLKSKGTLLLRTHFWQIAFDLFCASVIFYFLGGKENPLAPLILLSVVIGPLFLDFKESLVILIITWWSLFFQSYSPYFVNLEAVVNFSDQIGLIIIGTLIWSIMCWLSYALRQMLLRLLAIKAQNQKLDKLKALGALSAGFCHELATPFGTMNFCLKRMNENRSTEKDLEILNAAFNQCQNSLRSMLEMNSNEDQKILSPLSLKSFCESLLQEVCPSDFHYKIHSSLNEKVPLPKVPFSNCLIDLIENSLEAKATQIEIEIGSKAPFVFMNIQDNGQTISDYIIENLGEPFNTNKKMGTGIGLYNASLLMETLGGDLKISKNKTGGTCIHLKFLRERNFQ
ncbi:HAMP domain-containing sensor histidine kinase [Halobacteriovorax sp. GB3]|uniref:sensor histidine kinase n=1 Tax=Halobacteriovorax sp. GB3 TaxID=2719615 RepID=UPI00236209C6|nr:HAMP domain-containing sensor histidine kinase [Halobacteriovorax sp. GB3]MDD0853530.1 HAMP domain-containing sensor histidine kinase [Halobacteriovorax sp. GB3]